MKQVTVLSSFVRWIWDEETNTNLFFRYTQLSNGSSLGKKITQKEYEQEVGY